MGLSRASCCLLQNRPLFILLLLQEFVGARLAVERRAASDQCPLNSEYGAPDAGGDCLCAASRPDCYQEGRPGCTRADSRSDLHYFAANCKTCSCSVAGGSATNASQQALGSCTSAKGAEASSKGTDRSGLCGCPGNRPYCVSLDVLHDSPGCLQTDSWEMDDKKRQEQQQHQLAADTNRFLPGCPRTHCSCRATCPPNSALPYADELGNCACSAAYPACYQDGEEGCTMRVSQTAAVTGTSIAYFDAFCGSACECRDDSGGVCAPKSCIELTDCGFANCRDCDMCEGISRCPAQDGTGAANALLPDNLGNCKCKAQQQCFQGNSSVAGCPISPTGTSPMSFQVSCADCLCNNFGDVSTAALACPQFAKDKSPTFTGDCQCPDEIPECYQGGKRWCLRAGGQRDLYYFSPNCDDCECRVASSSSSATLEGRCPDSARDVISDAFGNCACPNDRPICVNGSGVLKMLCTTKQGWESSTEFGWNCSDCRCIPTEGSQSMDFAPASLLEDSGLDFARLDLVVDLRFVNSMNTLTEWKDLEEKVLLFESGKLAFAAAAAAAVAHSTPTEDAAAGICSELTILQSQDFPAENAETVRVYRFSAVLGVMWAELPETATTSPPPLVPNNSSSANRSQLASSSRKRKLQAGAVKSIGQLTATEKDVLLSLTTSWRGGLFKPELELSMQKLLNDTASWMTETAETPRVTLSRADLVSGNEYVEGLSLIGPLAAKAPLVLSTKDTTEENAGQQVAVASASGEQASGGFDIMANLPLIGAGAGGLLGLCISCYVYRRIIGIRQAWNNNNNNNYKNNNNNNNNNNDEATQKDGSLGGIARSNTRGGSDSPRSQQQPQQQQQQGMGQGGTGLGAITPTRNPEYGRQSLHAALSRGQSIMLKNGTPAVDGSEDTKNNLPDRHSLAGRQLDGKKVGSAAAQFALEGGAEIQSPKKQQQQQQPTTTNNNSK
ncbi:unnamed protein product [Polarella glacialis]|uniref:Uncharacterized protein n=1 Tax=Polarella glacialis TaxID=89957 RepID=A0A813L5N8_POLGL|nr:unnamed protein product [Polarella glacialis]